MCALKNYPDNNVGLNQVMCSMALYRQNGGHAAVDNLYNKSYGICAAKLNVDLEKMMECSLGLEGNKYQHEIALSHPNYPKSVPEVYLENKLLDGADWEAADKDL